MPALVTGTHLQLYKVEGKNSPKELRRFGEWTAAAKFDPVNDETGQCKHKDRHRKLEPVLKELKYKDKVKWQVLRTNVCTWVESTIPAFLIPVRIEEGTSGSVWDKETPVVKLAVGQMVYFDKPIVVDAGMDFLLVTDL